jgi:hypothetical protein
MLYLLEYLTVFCKAFSLANAKGKGTDDWVIRSLDWLKKKRSEISGRELQKPFGEFKTVNSLLMTKY